MDSDKLLADNQVNLNPATWLDEYGDILFSYAYAKVKDTALAEDLVQDTLLSAIKNLAGFESRSSVKTWLFTILKNKITDNYRKTASVARTEKAHSTSNNILDLPEISFNSFGIWNKYVPNWANDPEAILESKVFSEVLSNCIDKLPKRSQLAINKNANDLPADEICKELEISPSNLWVLLHRARLHLRECLEKNWYKNHEK
jgi:RNA polymerase sigma-70 factor (TIGR02943 family)